VRRIRRAGRLGRAGRIRLSGALLLPCRLLFPKCCFEGLGRVDHSVRSTNIAQQKNDSAGEGAAGGTALVYSPSAFHSVVDTGQEEHSCPVFAARWTPLV